MSGRDDPDAYEAAVCPACGAEAAEHRTDSTYECRACGAEFDADGGGRVVE